MNLPKCSGGQQEREFTYSESIFPGDSYKASIHTKKLAFYYETEEKVLQDGSINMEKYTVKLVDKHTRQLVTDNALEEKNVPNINVSIQYISTNKGAAKIKLEKSRTDADILLAFDVQSMELIKDELHELKRHDTPHEGDDNILITEKGLGALEIYKVKRAVFIVAGMGTRLYPFTKDRPKSLVEVNNNIYSAYLARDYLKNAYILDGDLLLTNKSIIQKYQYTCNYVGIFQNKTTDWCLEIEGERVASMKLGGQNCYLMYGVSYWDDQAGPFAEGDIIEIDSVDDLHAAEDLLKRMSWIRV
ncbi:hypothetical protein ABEX25_08005 [Paenibacillus thiaminolyticus]|uniref:hypothetical protein n=1 Tax=Paenibacillus thiaminolyticus TaxID=49283 RepID=UPI003D29199A